MAHRLALATIAAGLVFLPSACAGPVETLGRGSGTPLAPGSSVALVFAPGMPTDAPLRAALETALADAQFTVSPTSANRLNVGLSERSAQTAITTLEGAEIAPAKKQRLLQDCHDTTYRLVLSLETDGSPTPTQASAEESHCHGALAQSLVALSREAVAQLRSPGRDERRFRWGRD